MMVRGGEEKVTNANRLKKNSEQLYCTVQATMILLKSSDDNTRKFVETVARGFQNITGFKS